MLERGDRVLVAVSGGPDSVALLHVLWTLRDDLDISLHVGHLNHSMRGRESDLDASYVREFATNLGLPCTVEKVDVPRIRESLRLSPEEAARMVRYDFLNRLTDDVGATRIALGHTADDQVETVLMNILRGAGVDGLSGMPAVRDRFIRPLIETRRSEIEAYLAEHRLCPRLDETNLFPTYTRNRIRLHLLPLLRLEYNPDIDHGILRLAELARADGAYLNMEAEEALQRLTTLSAPGEVSLDPAGLAALPVSIRRRVIRVAVKALRGEHTDIGFQHVEELLRLLDTGRDFEYELPGGTFVRRTRRGVAFLSGRPAEVPITYCHEIVVPGRTVVPEIQAAIEAEVGHTPVDYMRPPGSLDVLLDRAKISGRLMVRNWQPGDRISPLGLRGSKKVQDLFVDAKIPREARHRVPIVVDNEKVVWVAGLALSEDVKITQTTTEFVRLRVATE